MMEGSSIHSGAWLQVHSWRRVTTAAAAALIVAATLTSWSGSSRAGAASHPKASGKVVVLYAGSLLDLMQQQFGPAFHKATGYTVSGYSNGSSALATEIKGGTQVGDVFISASPKADVSLQGVGNGDWVSTYKEFGTSPLVLGYNTSSKYAKDLRTKPWYNVVDLPNFLLGRTDPATDPKGVLAVNALNGVALSYGVTGLNALATSTSNIFPETALVGEIQAGQLDAGFFYAVEAVAAHLKTVPLVGTGLAAEYTVAILHRAPDAAAAKAFVKFLLSKAGQEILKKNGVTSVVPPVLFAASSGTTTTSSAPTTTTT
jgi:molybdate/tungstate transport system substrate-binding protein